MSLQAPYEPVETSQVLRAFPGDIDHLLPAYEDIPEEFKRLENPWVKFQRDWFFRGLSPDTQFGSREGIDAERAYYHLACIQRSYEPKHEHKEAAVAFLASLWFVGIKANGKVYGEDFEVVA